MEKIYIVVIECFWRTGEEYYYVADAFKNEKDAVKCLKSIRDNFLDEQKDNIAEIDENYRRITDNDTYYQFFDEGMGWNYEVSIIEKELK